MPRQALSGAELVTLAGSRPMLPMALGGSWYATDAGDADRIGAMEAAFEAGIRHFDTGAGYAKGHSEELLGQFLAGKRDELFIASKAHSDDLTPDAMLRQVEGSLRRLRVDVIDLYYIHWPRAGRDMRGPMEGLEQARRQGKIRAAGVSNFTVAQMQQVEEAGTIDAHQLGHNLLWRFAEQDVIPYCARQGITVVAYSALAHGILTGKFGPQAHLDASDQRHTILPFRPDVWPAVHAGVERLKALAAANGLPLAALAIRWLLAQPHINSVVVGARDRAQSQANAAILDDGVSPAVLHEATKISDEVASHIPDVGNLFDYYP